MSFQTIISWKICILHSEKNKKKNIRKLAETVKNRATLISKANCGENTIVVFFLFSVAFHSLYEICLKKILEQSVYWLLRTLYLFISPKAQPSHYPSTLQNLRQIWLASDTTLNSSSVYQNILYINRRGVPIVLKRQSTSSILWRHHRYQTQTRYGTSLTFVREVEVYVNAHRMIANAFLLLALFMAAGDVEL